MSDIRLVYNLPVDGTPRAHFREPLAPKLPDETDAAYYQRIMDKAGLAGVPFRVVAVKDIPDNRRVPFRDAWIVDGAGKIVVDLPTARKIRKRHLERQRDQHLAKLSAHVAMADDDDDSQRAKTLKKQRKAARELDLDAALAQVKTVEELVTFVPPELT